MAAVSNPLASPSIRRRFFRSNSFDAFPRASSRSNSFDAFPPRAKTESSVGSSQFVTPLTSVIERMFKSLRSPPSPIITNANSNPISNPSADTPQSNFFPSSSASGASSPPPSLANTPCPMTAAIATAAAADPESIMASEQVVAVTTRITNKTKHLDIGTSVILASDYAWICGLLFSSDATKTKMMTTYRELLIVITIIIIFSLCVGLSAFLTSVKFPVASRAMKVITILAGMVGAILSTFMIFLVLR